MRESESNVIKFIYITMKESMKQINKDNKVKLKYKGFFLLHTVLVTLQVHSVNRTIL